MMQDDTLALSWISIEGIKTVEFPSTELAVASAMDLQWKFQPMRKKNFFDTFLVRILEDESRGWPARFKGVQLEEEIKDALRSEREGMMASYRLVVRCSALAYS